MMITDSFLFDAGSLFFAVWIAVITAVSLAAFGRDLIPMKAQRNAGQEGRVADPADPRTR